MNWQEKKACKDSFEAAKQQGRQIVKYKQRVILRMTSMGRLYYHKEGKWNIVKGFFYRDDKE